MLWTTAGAAQDVLSLSRAVALTLANNPALRAADAGAREADQRLAQAQSGYLPRVNIVESWQRSDQPVFVFGSLLSQRRFAQEHFAIDALNHPDSTNNFRTHFAVEQPVFHGARTPSGVRAAKLGQTIAALERARLVADLALATTRAYGQVLRSQAARTAADAAVASAEEDLRRAQRRRDAGLETEASVLAIDVQLAQMRERRIRTESDESVARVELNQVMDVELGGAIDPAPEPGGRLAIRGKVTEIARALDPGSHAFLVKIDLPDHETVRSGMFGRARFAGLPRRALAVPAASLVRQGQLVSVFVVDAGGRARLRLVNVAAASGDLVEVLAGVTEGESVVIDPPVALADGARVAPERSGAKGSPRATAPGGVQGAPPL